VDTYKEGAGNGPELCLAGKDDSVSAEVSISAASCECGAVFGGGASALDNTSRAKHIITTIFFFDMCYSVLQHCQSAIKIEN